MVSTPLFVVALLFATSGNKKYAGSVHCWMTAGFQWCAKRGIAELPAVPERKDIFQGHRTRRRQRIAALLLTDVRKHLKKVFFKTMNRVRRSHRTKQSQRLKSHGRHLVTICLVPRIVALTSVTTKYNTQYTQCEAAR